ncbi:diguanylate cyclase [Cellvibrio sp.]|uniref:diguanylate cyclase n=1 Tax=Cellvibrio sp. TaxID=1965322 RepID=UPI0039648A55
MKILLVEDSATLRYAMRNYIIEAGHTPLIAQSGEEALQMLETTPVDMIIMDVEMPGLNGFETTRLIREWLGGHWIPIIFVTGRNEDESYREGIEAGGDDYLIKPVSAMIIKAKIRAMERITEMRDQLNQLNAELEALSQLDSLTQTYNRRTFNEMAQQQWLLATRQQGPISVLMIDVDHFKLYNDHYGHPAGDACLKRVTQAIRDCLNRPYDLLGRYGGEEFIVLLPETDCHGALKVADAINAQMEKLGLRHEVSPTREHVTVSIGGASCAQTLTHSLEDLIKGADRALYKAKHSGRNRSLVDDIAVHKTILVVEQDTDATKSLIQMLTPQYNILYTETADEALDICLDIHPDLILMDAAIADENNERLCRQLARNPKTNAIPIVLISDENCSYRPISDVTIGIRGCLEKPIDKDALQQKIQFLIH